MKDLPNFFYLILFFCIGHSYATYGGPLYDYSAYTECKVVPEDPLYGGGIIKGQTLEGKQGFNKYGRKITSPSFLLHNLTANTMYTFSGWIKISGADTGIIKAGLITESNMYKCVGTVTAEPGCWSFIKGGFVLDSPSNSANLFFQNTNGTNIDITVASPSLQPFSDQQWRMNQEYKINTERKRMATIHVSDQHGDVIQGAEIGIQQLSKDFPIGSAIADTILGNLPYQKWFVERFNAAVLENELKWYATEPQQGKVNYTIPDQMMEFVRSNQITVRGHNIFWENPQFTPSWVRNLNGSELKKAVNSRIQSLITKYKNEFVHWDVDNEMLHFDFYEERLGHNISLQFFETAHKSDPLATLFMNEYNVVETCDDLSSSVDVYISKLRELQRGGVFMDGIGLEGHFTVPNPPLIRAVLDKMATLELPIWLTEIDISNTLDKETQGKYLEVVLREVYSHPSVTGIMLWTALHPAGCYEMCLTDNDLGNLPAGDVVDKLLKEWQSGLINGKTDEHGSFSFNGFMGEYEATVRYGSNTTSSTFSLCPGQDTRHFSIQLHGL